MEKIGDKIKKYRLEKNMTQNQLAAGICTQATISNLENNSSLPSISNLLLIAERLMIKHADLYDAILVNTSGYMDAFNKIKHLQRENKYIESNQVLRTMINCTKLASVYEKKEYYYYFGMSSLKGYNDFSDAHYYFNQCLALPKVDDLAILDLLATVGIADAYDLCSEVDKAETYFVKAASQLEHVNNWKKSFHDKLAIIEAFQKAATFYAKMKKYSVALRLSKSGIAFHMQEDINQGLEDLMEVNADCLFHSGNLAGATEGYFYASALARLNKNEERIQSIKKQLLNRNIPPFDYLTN